MEQEITIENTSLTQEDIARVKEQLLLEQRLPLAIITGVAAAIVSAVLWAVITVATEMQIGFMAIGVGLLVGYSIRFAGRGILMIFGIIGAICALFGCVLGNYLSQIGFLGNKLQISYFEALKLVPMEIIPDIMIESFSPMDLLFYGFAVWEGFKFSFREIK